MGSKINSIATIFTMDVYRPLFPQTSQQRLVLVGRITAVVALITAGFTAKPLLGSFEQAFQYIQEFTGFFTPGICVIFLLGLFWPRCTATAALVAAIASGGSVGRADFTWPSLPFMDRVGIVFLACMAIAIVLSLLEPPREAALTVDLQEHRLFDQRGFQHRGAGHYGHFDRSLRDLVVVGMNTRAAELTPVAILPVHNTLGEGILWDSRRQVLWWTDIQGRRLYRHDLMRASTQILDTPERVGSFGLVAGSERLITAFESGIALYDTRGWRDFVAARAMGTPTLRCDSMMAGWTARAVSGVVRWSKEIRVPRAAACIRRFHGSGCAVSSRGSESPTACA